MTKTLSILGVLVTLFQTSGSEASPLRIQVSDSDGNYDRVYQDECIEQFATKVEFSKWSQNGHRSWEEIFTFDYSNNGYSIYSAGLTVVLRDDKSKRREVRFRWSDTKKSVTKSQVKEGLRIIEGLKCAGRTNSERVNKAFADLGEARPTPAPQPIAEPVNPCSVTIEYPEYGNYETRKAIYELAKGLFIEKMLDEGILVYENISKAPYGVPYAVNITTEWTLTMDGKVAAKEQPYTMFISLKGRHSRQAHARPLITRSAKRLYASRNETQQSVEKKFPGVVSRIKSEAQRYASYIKQQCASGH